MRTRKDSTMATRGKTPAPTGEPLVHLIPIDKVTPPSDIFFFQADDGIRVRTVTGVQTCALPICAGAAGDAELCEPGPDHRRRPPGAPGDRRAPRRRPHRGPPDRHGPDPTRDGRAHLRRLALLSQRGDAPARPDHYEPARDARGLRDDPRA